MVIQRKQTRGVKIGPVVIENGSPIALQSRCATRTRGIEATVEQAESRRKAGAAVVRIAIDSDRDAEALKEIRKQTTATISVDLQENYRLAAKIAQDVDKIRY